MYTRRNPCEQCLRVACDHILTTTGIHRGLYEEEDGSSEIEAEYNQNHSIGSYFAHHARKQLAFDIWWLGLAIWAICIVERANLVDPETDSYFNVFTIMFEVRLFFLPVSLVFLRNSSSPFQVVSAYGTVGLSLGTPTVSETITPRIALRR